MGSYVGRKIQKCSTKKETEKSTGGKSIKKYVEMEKHFLTC